MHAVEACAISAVFVLSALEIILPYSIELLMVLSFVPMAVYAVIMYCGRHRRPQWITAAEALLLAALFLTSLLFIFTGVYEYYYAAEVLMPMLVGFVILRAFVELRQSPQVNVRLRKISLLVGSFFVLAVMLLGAVSRIGYGRSMVSTLAELALSAKRKPESAMAAQFDRVTEAGEVPFKLKEQIFRQACIKSDFDGMDVYFINSDANYENVIFYLHGGSYIYHVSDRQLKAMSRILDRTNSMLVVPIYSLAPFHTVDENFDRMVNLYNKTAAENKGRKMTLIGDSAGGGFALALAEGLSSQPDELILISPWVDIGTNNSDIQNYMGVDPMVTVTLSQISGEAWAGAGNVSDWRVSPINGDLSKLRNVTVFVGTREIFYPDNMLLFEKLQENHVPNARLFIGKGLNHVYPCYPTLEGRMAIEEISRTISR